MRSSLGELDITPGRYVSSRVLLLTIEQERRPLSTQCLPSAHPPRGPRSRSIVVARHGASASDEGSPLALPGLTIEAIGRASYAHVRRCLRCQGRSPRRPSPRGVRVATVGHDHDLGSPPAPTTTTVGTTLLTTAPTGWPRRCSVTGEGRERLICRHASCLPRPLGAAALRQIYFHGLVFDRRARRAAHRVDISSLSVGSPGKYHLWIDDSRTRRHL